jgi:hypothetical protein
LLLLLLLWLLVFRLEIDTSLIRILVELILCERLVVGSSFGGTIVEVERVREDLILKSDTDLPIATRSATSPNLLDIVALTPNGSSSSWKNQKNDPWSPSYSSSEPASSTLIVVLGCLAQRSTSSDFQSIFVP